LKRTWVFSLAALTAIAAAPAGAVTPAVRPAPEAVPAAEACAAPNAAASIPWVASAGPAGSEAARPADPDRWLGRDKAQHAVVSMLLTAALSRAARLEAGAPRRRAVFIGAGCAVSIGCLKEIFDGLTGRGRASRRDLAADVLGTGAGALALAWW
jgi:uncharacterized protein YfiM (DUF2279 family)